ncbi:hypothetical protein GCM10010411_77000 [Actinomadura fulvescens]|uniref:Uncharacterized protein n=1 Tax=Actinomadura fulvescens TaxID=46160 RepID=A0ABP6D0K9_9ACTN
MRSVEALLRHHATPRERVVDDHMFVVEAGHTLPAAMRLQVFTAPGAVPVMVAVQTTGEGPSLINAAETYCAAAWRRHCPDSQHPPVWIQRQILPSGRFDSFDLVTFEHIAAPYTLTGPQWRSICDDDLARLVGGPVDRDRGARHVPRPPVPEKETGYRVIRGVRLPRPQPFRAPTCMPVGIPFSRRIARQLRPDQAPRDCCWYHGGPWTAATRIAVGALRQARRERVPVDELTGCLMDLIVQADLPTWQRQAAESLVLDPLALRGDGRSYVNGQHRAQAILDQGVRTVLVAEDVDPPDRAELEAALQAWLDEFAPGRL